MPSSLICFSISSCRSSINLMAPATGSGSLPWSKSMAHLRCSCTTLPGIPTTVDPSGTDFNTTEPAPTLEQFPILMLPIIFCSGACYHTTSYGGVSFYFLQTGTAQNHTLIDQHVVSYFCGFTDYHSHSMVDEHSSTDDCTGVDFNSGKQSPQGWKESACKLVVAGPEPVSPSVSLQSSSAVVSLCILGFAGFWNCCGCTAFGIDSTSSCAFAIAPGILFAPGVRTISAPKVASNFLLSRDMVSGMVSINRYPWLRRRMQVQFQCFHWLVRL